MTDVLAEYQGGKRDHNFRNGPVIAERCESQCLGIVTLLPMNRVGLFVCTLQVLTASAEEGTTCPIMQTSESTCTAAYMDCSWDEAMFPCTTACRTPSNIGRAVSTTFERFVRVVCGRPHQWHFTVIL